mmetsp:Transcript_48685/g.141052  ORF Transcript_48685/g.141052 Transcript_48685/m.141052 type:complete len:211 (+) Transcript_48685:418-1050(+)
MRTSLVPLRAKLEPAPVLPRSRCLLDFDLFFFFGASSLCLHELAPLLASSACWAAWAASIKLQNSSSFGNRCDAFLLSICGAWGALLGLPSSLLSAHSPFDEPADDELSEESSMPDCSLIRCSLTCRRWRSRSRCSTFSLISRRSALISAESVKTDCKVCTLKAPRGPPKTIMFRFSSSRFMASVLRRLVVTSSWVGVPMARASASSPKS